MKTIKKTVLVALMLGTLTSYANGTVNSEENRKEKISYVTLKEIKKGHQLYIKDSENRTLYKETLKKSGTFVKRFDFKSLTDGEYFLVVHKDFETIKTPFIIKKGIAFFNEDKREKTFKPVIKVKDSNVLISKLNFEASSLSVQIYYKGNQIHSEKVTGTSIISRIYQLNPTYKGSYTVLVTSNEHTYKNSFVL